MFVGRTLMGMDSLSARYYGPQVGRFVSEDLGQDSGNWYWYADANPTNKVDFACMT